MRYALMALERFFRNTRGQIGLLRRGGMNDPRCLEMQKLCGEIEQTLVRCQILYIQLRP
jgi:hypothetical protein